MVHDYPYIVQDENNHLYKITSKEYYAQFIEFIQQCLLHSINLLHFTLQDILSTETNIHPLFIVFHIPFHFISIETPHSVSFRL